MRMLAVAIILHLGACEASAQGASHDPRSDAFRYSAVPKDWRKPYNCSLAVVRGLRGGRQLLVRAGPTVRHRVLARLSQGDRVYICNEGGGWLGIAFSSPGRPCGNPRPVSLDVRAAANCRSGWVRETWIEILTG